MDIKLLRQEICKTKQQIQFCKLELNRLQKQEQRLVYLLYEADFANTNIMIPNSFPNIPPGAVYQTLPDTRSEIYELEQGVIQAEDNNSLNSAYQYLNTNSSQASSDVLKDTPADISPSFSPLSIDGMNGGERTQKGFTRSYSEKYEKHLLFVADSIFRLIIQDELSHFEVQYLAQKLDLREEEIGQVLQLDLYKHYWQPLRNSKTGNGDLSQIWLVNLEQIEREKKENSRYSKPQQLEPKRSKPFKKSLPPHDLVDDSKNVRDLLDRVFKANRRKRMSSGDILEYLYPNQTIHWSKEERRSRLQLISRELCTSINVGCWRRVARGLYIWKG